ncbi:1,4-dihydroxy-6-naphthoate synthase [Candidatus Nitrososphaera evergladensis SR1]|jgi:1,4-dihydroxy-6-naphthoate synthase|uniref:1,4-dihydroxy-6-naphtoate synthase n=2 Tax=Nitrososphaera TaxID=497726 RepID=A0A075MPU7_9ARCH|nr:1,4-dihydroxy-6-naphthoate synthase [Candidatus Nitrososphaera evergladensis SR1]
MREMEITLGHTPDADDAFMFYGFACGAVGSSRFAIKHVIQDIETLNKRALAHELDATAVSAHAYAYLKDYVILRGGGSFGLKYGPVVIARKDKGMTLDGLKDATIAIPGRMTSANLLLKLAIGKFREKEMSFEAIPQAVLTGEVDAGLVIHEAQITYDKTKFAGIMELGQWWDSQTGGLPVPLGINVASARTMDRGQLKEFSDLFVKSIEYGLDNIDASVDYAMQYSRGQPKETIKKFVLMYVNEITRDMGPEGRKAIEKMFSMACERRILESDVRVDVI